MCVCIYIYIYIRPNSPIGLWPSWPPNHPHTLIGFISVFSPPVSWCVGGVLVQYGCRRIIRWMLHTVGGWGNPPPPLLCKALWVPRKVLYKCKELLLIIYIHVGHNYWHSLKFVWVKYLWSIFPFILTILSTPGWLWTWNCPAMASCFTEI